MSLRTHFKHIFFITMISCAVFSQDKRLARADEDFNRYAFIDARNTYLNVAERGYTSAELYKKLGDSYYFNAAFEEAVIWYEKLVNEYEAAAEAEYLFRYAQSLKSVERYDEADRIMEKFSAVISNDQRAAFFTSTRDYLKFIAMQSGKFDIREVPVNSAYSDYAPSYDHQGKLVFASSRLGNTLSKKIHQWNEMPFLDLFTLDSNTLTDSLTPLPRKLKGKINTRFHESSTAFGKDGTTVYFTRNNYTGGKLRTNSEGTTLLKLYRATRNGDTWENIEELPFNSDEYSVAHPALSPDEKKLYFASDMPGSKGMSDLYVVTINEDGTFGTPQNLGNQINTESRETFPYIGDSGSLYFASDGHMGLGGLDVFVAVPAEDGSFSIPYNIGEPVNSPEDDFTFIIDEAGKTGYFASNRSGGMGDDDIYSFVQTGTLITRCNQYVNGVATDIKTNEILPDTEVVLLDSNNTEIARTVTDSAGVYAFDVKCNASYLVKGVKTEYKPVEATFATTNTFEQKHEVPLQLEKEEIFEAGVDLAKLLGVIIYFDSAKSNIRPDAAAELQKIIDVLKEYPGLKIDVRSHTDSKSSARYNMALSERRVQSTIKYIVEQGGIDPSRVTGRGYGETQLLNECKDGVKCTKAQHQLNRRSEFIVVE